MQSSPSFTLAFVGCSPQTASDERLYKEHAGQQAKARNRMALRHRSGSPLGLATLEKVTTVKSAEDQEERRILSCVSGRETGCWPPQSASD